MAPKPKLSPTQLQADRARHRAQRALWRLAAWGGAATAGLIAVALASQTETGTEQLQMAFSGISGPTATAKVAEAERRADEAQAQVRLLAAEVRKLNADRARLDARLAGIERDFNDLTGALGKKVAPTTPAAQTFTPAPATFAPLTLIAPLTLPGGVSALTPWPGQTPQPKTAELSEPHPVRTIAVTRPQAEPAPAATQAPAPAKIASPPVAIETPPPAQPAPARVATVEPPPSPAAPPKLGGPPQTVAVEPLPTATIKPAPKVTDMVNVPMPPLRMAAIPQSQPAAPPKREYGIDIGGASSTAVLNARWAEMKANYGPQVAGLRPLIAHDRHAGHLRYRLLIGPLPSSAAAAELCVQFRLSRSRCRPTRFLGEPLAHR